MIKSKCLTKFLIILLGLGSATFLVAQPTKGMSPAKANSVGTGSTTKNGSIRVKLYGEPASTLVAKPTDHQNKKGQPTYKFLTTSSKTPIANGFITKRGAIRFKTANARLVPKRDKNGNIKRNKQGGILYYYTSLNPSPNK